MWVGIGIGLILDPPVQGSPGPPSGSRPPTLGATVAKTAGAGSLTAVPGVLAVVLAVAGVEPLTRPSGVSKNPDMLKSAIKLKGFNKLCYSQIVSL